MFKSATKNLCHKRSFISRHSFITNELYYRQIPHEASDMTQIKHDLDIGINMILDGIDSFDMGDNTLAIDKILDGLFALTYQRHLMDWFDSMVLNII